MGKRMNAPRIDIVKRQRTDRETERSRELRELHEAAVERRRQEAAAARLHKAEGVSPEKMGECQPPNTEPRESVTSHRQFMTVTEAGRFTLSGSESQPCAAASLPMPDDDAGYTLRRARPGRERQLPSASPRPAALGLKSTVPTRLEITAEAFAMDRQLRRCTKMTVDGYQRDIAAFGKWLEEHGILEPTQISAQHARLFLFEIDCRQVSAWTLRHYIGSLRAFCNFLVGEGILTRSPMANIRMPRVPAELPTSFTVNEVRLLLDAAKVGKNPARDVAIILALLDTGCRCTEFLAVKVGDVDLKSGQVIVRQGKGQRDRVTFLGEKGRTATAKYLRERPRPARHEPLWITSKGECLTNWGLRQLLERLAHRAGLTDVHPHKFRRTFALWSLRAGMNIYCLQALMGHSTLTMLQRYLALVEADLEKQHREHGAVDSML